jgi:hypothetical protein
VNKGGGKALDLDKYALFGQGTIQKRQLLDGADWAELLNVGEDTQSGYGAVLGHF